jgi:glycosyltransferase involved in cell wall biosynthesis
MPNAKLPISVIILSRNEEAHIARALRSVAFAAEILVIDGESSDQTRVIAEKLGAKVLVRPWPGFREQRNFSLGAAQHEWVLVLDADESVSPQLEAWLRDFFVRGGDTSRPSGYKIHRREYFLGEAVTGACWNPSYQDRFFARSKAKYVGEIHEYPLVEGGLERAPEDAIIEHNPRVNVESIIEKMNRYTTVEAWDRFQLGERTNFLHMGVTFFSTWWKNYFYYKAYRDGARGFVVALLEAISRTVRHIKLWQIQQMKAENREGLLISPERALKAGASLHRQLETTKVENE